MTVTFIFIFCESISERLLLFINFQNSVLKLITVKQMGKLKMVHSISYSAYESHVLVKICLYSVIP